MSINVNSNVVNNISNKGSDCCKKGETTDRPCPPCPTIYPTPPTPYPTPIPTPCPPRPCPQPPCPRPEPPCIPLPPPPQPKCCVVIVPCATQGCNPYHFKCQGCYGRYGYLPQNPCTTGCHKRETIGCSSCNENYYQTFSGYSSCHGCYYQ